MENIKNSLEQQEKFGRNIEIILKFMRHGDRDKQGNLLDIGRETTKKTAVSSNIRKDEFNAVKAIGSNAAPIREDIKMGRAMETADIYATEIAGDEKFKSRVSDVLNYETLKSPAPYNHREIYNKNLPSNFEQLGDDDKIKASKVAQTAVVNHVISLYTPEAITYKEEMAGAYAYVIEHYQEMAKRLYSGSKVLIPAGTHGGVMEFLLQQALITKDNDGKEKTGIDNIKEIGGEFDPSDSFNIDVKTDSDGNFKEFKVSFDNINRPQEEMFLDTKKVHELADTYKKLHDLK